MQPLAAVTKRCDGMDGYTDFSSLLGGSTANRQDCSSTASCSNSGFSCFIRDSTFAQCRKRCPSHWDCAVLKAPHVTLNGKYLLDSSATVGTLTIPSGSELIFADVANLHLSVKDIVVKGKFQLGTASCPLEKSGITITLRGGSDYGIYEEHADHSKGIVVQSGGIFEAHGKVYQPTWTRLAENAAAGATQLVLSQDVDWEVGMQLVVVTTDMIDEIDDHQNEVRTITAVSGNTVTVDSPLSHMHYGGAEYQAEVALLSRSITIQGDEHSEQSSFGGHTICMPGCSVCKISYVKGYRLGQKNVMGRYPFHFHEMGSIDDAIGYFKGNLVYRSYFRAYTIHGTSSASISRNVAFDVEGNAFYLEDGVEENNLIEFNLAAFIHIIGMLDLDSTGYGTGQPAPAVIATTDARIVPTDVTAAGFYCLNQANNWTGNAASGGFTGFLFPNLPAVVGDSYSKDEYSGYVPGEKLLLNFDGNTAHSSGRHWKGGGACMYVGGKLWQKDGDKGTHVYQYDYGRIPGDNILHGGMVFKNTKVFICRRGFMFWGAHGKAAVPQVTLENYEAHDIQIGAQMLGKTNIKNAVMSATTDNTGVTHTSGSPGYGSEGVPTDAIGFPIYDTGAMTVLDSVTYRNYNREGDRVLQDMTHSSIFAPQGLLSMNGIKWVNTPQIQRASHERAPACKSGAGGPCAGKCGACPGTTVASQHANILDVDGSVTGFSGGGIAGANDNAAVTGGGTNDWWKLDDDCELKFTVIQDKMKLDGNVRDGSTNGFWTCRRISSSSWATQPRQTVAILPVIGTKKPSSWKNDRSVAHGTVYHFGRSDRYIQVGLSDNLQVTGACCDIGWYLHLDGGAVRSLMLYMTSMVPEGGMVVATSYPTDASFRVQKCRAGSCFDVQLASSKAEFVAADGLDYKYWHEDGTIFIKLVNDGNAYYQPDATLPGKLLYPSGHFRQQRYVITSTHSGDVPLSIPAADWLSR